MILIEMHTFVSIIYYGDSERRYSLYLRWSIIGDTILSDTEIPIKIKNILLNRFFKQQQQSLNIFNY